MSCPKSLLPCAISISRTSAHSIEDPVALDPLEPDLVVVLGGPVGAYEASAYPFLADEISFLEKRLACNRPTFGILPWRPVDRNRTGRAGKADRDQGNRLFRTLSERCRTGRTARSTRRYSGPALAWRHVRHSEWCNAPRCNRALRQSGVFSWPQYHGRAVSPGSRRGTGFRTLAGRSCERALWCGDRSARTAIAGRQAWRGTSQGRASHVRRLAF